MVYTRIFDGESLPFNQSEALRYFGYGKNQTPPQEVKNLFDECVKEALALCTYKVCYASFDILREEDGKTLNLGFTNTHSKSLSRNLEECDRVIAFCATIGLDIDRLINRYSSIFPVKAYAFQAVGAERIETLCKAFNGQIKAECAAQGLFTRPRFSCGYGDFSLDKQKDFFTALDCARKIGVTLSEGLLMSPSKSVTALIGVGKTPCAKEKDKCSNCYNQNCSFRE